MTWNDAKISCENKNSTLAQILDVETFSRFVDKKMWIGLSFSPVWVWSETQQISTFMNWKTGQPNNEFDCSAILVEDGTWTTESCIQQYPFFCSAGMNDISLVLTLKSVSRDGMTRKHLLHINQDIMEIIYFFV